MSSRASPPLLKVENLNAGYDGMPVLLHADTLCIHGDTPGAVEYARAVRAALEAAGVVVAPLTPRAP